MNRENKKVSKSWKLVSGLLTLLCLSVLLLVLSKSDLQKTIPLVLLVLLPYSLWNALPRCLALFKNNGELEKTRILLLSFATAIILYLFQSALFPVLQHRLDINISVTESNKKETPVNAKILLAGIGTSTELTNSAEKWVNFKWHWKDGSQIGKIGDSGETILYSSHNHLFLYFSEDSNRFVSIKLVINGERREFVLGDYSANSGYYLVPVRTDKIAMTAMRILFMAHLFLFILLMFLTIQDAIRRNGGKGDLYSLVGIVFFFVLIFLPLIGMAIPVIPFNPEEFEEYEKRAPYQFPIDDIRRNFPNKSVGEIPGFIENWYNDRFGYRYNIIQLYSFLNYRFLRTSILEDRIIVGKNGFLFVGDFFQKVVSKHRGLYVSNEKRYDSWAKAQESKFLYLEKRGIPFVFLMAPDKHSIYPEYLPRWFSKNVGPSYTEFTKDAASRYSFPFIDPTEDLLAAKEKDGDILYGKTDTHWTALGAYIAYAKLITEINQRYNIFIPLVSLKEMKIEYLSEGYHLAKMLKLDDIVDFHDHDVSFTLDDSVIGKIQVIPENQTPWIANSYYKIPWDNQYRLVNEEPQVPYRALIYRDSFCSEMSPFLNHTFSEILYIHFNKGLKDFTKTVTEFKPDIVIIEVGERGMNFASLFYNAKD